jgi:hypothetical protein
MIRSSARSQKRNNPQLEFSATGLEVADFRNRFRNRFRNWAADFRNGIES